MAWRTVKLPYVIVAIFVVDPVCVYGDAAARLLASSDRQPYRSYIDYFKPRKGKSSPHQSPLETVVRNSRNSGPSTKLSEAGREG